MQVQLRSRVRLLSRVSTLAIIAAATTGGLGIVEQVQAAACSGTTVDVTTPTTLTGNIECVRVNTEVAGDIKNQAAVGDPGAGYSPFFVGSGGIVDGQVWNDATISGGYPGSGGEGSGLGALTIANGGQILGGVLNTGQIQSANNGLQIGTSSGGGETTSGTLSGGVTNNAGISGFNDGIAAISGDFSGGLVNNSNGVISGGNAGVYIADTFSDWSGGITNHGTLKGTNGPAIQIGTYGSSNVDFSGGIYNDGTISSVQGAAIFASGNSFSDGLTNYGLITETGGEFGGIYGGAGVVFDASSVSGDINNYGTIDGFFRQGILVTSNVNVFNGSITNTNVIDGGEGGVVVRAGTVNGNFSNSGLITGGFTGVLYSNNDIHGPGGEGFTGNFTNTGSIIGGAAGFLVFANNVEADFVNGGGEGQGLIKGNSSAGVVLDAFSWNGNITNHGTIQGETVGVAIGYDPFFGKSSPGNHLTGSFLNDGTINGGSGAGVMVMVDNYNGNFTNNGTITGGRYGAAIGGSDLIGVCGVSCGSSAFVLSAGGGTFTGTISNSGYMSGDTALFVSYDNVNGSFSNTGTLQGVTHGLYIDVDNFQGNFTNTGTITAGGEGTGVAALIGSGSTEGSFVISDQSFTGDFNNTGIMHGAETGLRIVLDSYTGAEGGEGFTNSGTITGDQWAGLSVNVNSWQGNFTNEAGGVIEGGVTGAYFNAGTISGDFSNFGSIIGHGFDTGWSINTPSFTGNITNGVSGLISAPSNALHLSIDSFTGQISNAGVIAASSGDAVRLNGYSGNGTYTGTFTNTGTINGDGAGIALVGAQITGGIDNNGGTIIGSRAIDTYSASGATTITNEGNGVIIGDLRLSNNFGDTFIGEDGGIVGNIIGDPSGGEGNPNDDKVIVQNGTQYFVGKASNLASFTVNNNGFAVLGSTFEGDTAGDGFSSSNVDSVVVNNGGTLYIDKSATLTTGSYTQQSGGTLEFYLGAPAGIASATGDITAASGDYGQVHVTGSAALDGAIAGFLDPQFGSANAGLNSVTYNDVLVADGGITGDFSTLALISNNTVFQLDEVLDGNTVDLTVLRAGGIGQIADIGGIVVDAGGPWKSMVNDRSNGIGSGSCGIAGPGWCLNAYAANETGSTSVMNDATPGADPFDWLRTGQRRQGETAVWGRAVGVWGDTNGDNTGHFGTDFDTFGGIVGVDHVFTPILMAGVAAQYTKTNIDFKQLADNADVKSFEVGGYMSYGDARFYLNANTSVIFHDLDVTRFDNVGRAHGSYNGTTYSAYAEAGKIFETYEGFRIQPLAALSYAHLDTDSYNETGSAVLLHVFDASLDSLKSMLGGRFAYPITMDSGRKFVPEVRAIWSHEFMDDHSSFLANPIGNPGNVSLVTGETYNRDSLILGAGFALPISDGTSLFLDYDANLNEDITTHTVSGGFRSRW